MKQPNGTGSIIKLGGKRRKPYAVVKTIGWVQNFDDNGLPAGRPRQKRQYVGYYASRKEALKALAALNDETPTPNVDTPKTAAFQPYTPTFEQLWKTVRNLKANEIEKTSLMHYDLSYARSEPIHDKRIDDITYLDLQKLMNAYAKTGKTKGMLSLYKTFFTMMFNEAIKMNYVQANPASLLVLKATKESEEKIALTPAQIKAIHASKAKSRDLVMILIYTGLRISELLDINEIHDDYIIAGVKTKAGKHRIIPVHPQIKEELQRFLKQKKVNYNTYRRRLIDDLPVYGVEFTFHECRHTFVTLANEYGADMTTLKKIVGHKTKDVTEAVYLHTRIETLKREIMKIPMVADL